MSSHKILIVDDADETRLFLKGLIKQLGYEIREAQNGFEALKIIEAEKIDLVLLDVLMPNLNGFETFDEISKKNSDHKIKVVFLTGKKMGMDLPDFHGLKPDDIVHKSISGSLLKEKLKRLLA